MEQEQSVENNTVTQERKKAVKERVGTVVSAGKMQKTLVVEAVTRVPHPRYGKIVKKRKRFYAHDEQQQAQEGDTVRIRESRPMSKLKRWQLVEVVKR
jgi:small subunit ribosomal protein S17